MTAVMILLALAQSDASGGATLARVLAAQPAVMILLALAQSDASGGATLARVLAAQPEHAGTLLLAGETHAPIVAVARRAPEPLQPPLTVDVDLVERPRRVAGGCVRRRWVVVFRHAPQQMPAEALPASRFALTEVVLGRGRCPQAGYTRVNPGLTADDAIRALSVLSRIVKAPGEARMTCTSSIDAALCSSRTATLAQLATAPAWLIRSTGARTVSALLGRPGSASIEVRFDPAAPRELRVTREIPPPA